jgi:hypothetical protein
MLTNTVSRKRQAQHDVHNVDFDQLDSYSTPGRARTASGRKVRKTKALNIMFNSRYMNPQNVKT